MSVSTPPLISVPFADSGAKNLIPIASASPLASYTDGFPVVTMTDPDAGGVPPSGEDFNGIFNIITQHLLYINSGGKYRFNADQATAIGGYPLGFVVQSNDGGSEYVSLIGANTYDPNTPTNVGPYWAPYAGAASMDGHYAIDTGAANAYVVAQSPARSANTKGNLVTFKAAHTNTGASTINTGGGVVDLRRNDGTALQAADIVAGGVYVAVYDSATGHYYIASPVPSQYAPPSYQTSLGSTKNLRSYATGNNASVPVSADLISLGNGIGGYLTFTSVSEVIDSSASGVNGLDIGVLDVSTWYYTYLIYDEATATMSALCSLSPTSPTLPGTYSFFRRVGAFFTDATANKYPLAFVQRGAEFQQVTGLNPSTYRIMSSGAHAWPYAVSLASFIPPTAVAVRVYVEMSGTCNTGVGANSSDYTGFYAGGTGMSIRTSVHFLVESDNIYYYGSGNDYRNSRLDLLGWTDSI